MKKNLLPILLAISFLSLISALVVVLIGIADDNKKNDVSVSLNANKEVGYPYALPILIEKRNKTIAVCGATIIGDGVAVTAGHCAEDATALRVFQRPLDIDGERFANIKTIYDAPGFQGFADGWQPELTRNDMSILEFEDESQHFTKKAVVGSPENGCNYRLVTYGTTLSEKNSEGIDVSTDRYAQGQNVCISQIDAKNFLVSADGSGICFGDSGSPIFEKGTNKIVGIISSTIGKNEEALCNLNNQAIAVRLDTKYEFISQHVDVDLENIDSDIDDVIAVNDIVLTDSSNFKDTSETTKVNKKSYEESLTEEKDPAKKTPGKIEKVNFDENSDLESAQVESDTLDLSTTQILLIVGLVAFGLIMIWAIFVFVVNGKYSNNKLQIHS